MIRVKKIVTQLYFQNICYNMYSEYTTFIFPLKNDPALYSL